VPSNFDPQKSWPLLLISATVDASSIELLSAYQREALAAGWVIIAADSPVKPKDDNTERRLATIEAGLDFLDAHWPAARNWPIACGGFSGGAKRSGYVAAALTRQQRRIIGMLMGGCNEDKATAGLKRFNPSVTFKGVPIFLSSGMTDQVATPSMIQYVEKSMKFSGFRKVRLETYPGAHDVYPEHTTAALQWFVASSPGGASPSPHSDFDKFFKKP
jgi:predicted esterase